MHGVNVFLMAHPTKMIKEKGKEKYVMPTLYDVKGSGDFYDQTHNGLTVYRHFGEDPFTQVVSTKLKFKHQGLAGQDTAFKFNVSNGRYYPYIGKPDSESLISKETKIDIQLYEKEIDDDPIPF
jgi:twinkle protein